MKSFFWENDPKFNIFGDYFTGKEDHELQKLYICHFENWLSESEYSRYIENATRKEVEFINKKRLHFFLSFYGTSVILDRKNECFFQPKCIEEFKSYCVNSLDDNADFLIVDYANWIALNTGYDFTDICYFIDGSNLPAIESKANKSDLYAFKDDS